MVRCALYPELRPIHAFKLESTAPPPVLTSSSGGVSGHSGDGDGSATVSSNVGLVSQISSSLGSGLPLSPKLPLPLARSSLISRSATPIFLFNLYDSNRTSIEGKYLYICSRRGMLTSAVRRCSWLTHFRRSLFTTPR